MGKLSLQAMIEAAVFAAFALLLDLLPSIEVTHVISLSFAMLPVFVVAFRWGFKASVASGFIWSLLQIVTGDANDILNPIQGIMEYPVAFSFIGFAGLFRPLIERSCRHAKRGTMTFWICLSVLAGSFARYFWHFVAGVFFWGSYAPKGQSAFLYSFITNGVTMIGNGILCAAVAAILFNAAPQLLTKYRNQHGHAA
ncbi:energy-coupled thiamine transporter ThiT [Heyndrickxia coagulans]|uniref:energy-coupled thiamine transporter ThiT n=1 Tax=Heyndrickxia coagulans TaxID=1398 RepID=UPI000E4FAAB8|nr:energy-coupled thiamine transporter ThiT [Heyndrickxia coagulans]MED4935855.1 energy-coupled thiamine transporter ThiT [Heyndrickxia coagulans]RGR86269.1 energy-coupled thiamine transporter ThiT [Heyndrickxia coagulans]